MNRRLPSLLFPRGGMAAGGVLAAVLNAAMRVAILPVLVTPLFDRVLIGNDLDALPPILALAGAVVVLGSLALWAQDALLATAAARTAERWRSALYRDLLARRPGTLPGSSGGLASRILGDLREIESWFQFGLGTTVAESATLLGIFLYLLWTDPLATLLLLVFGAPTALALRRAGRTLERFADRTQEGVEALGRSFQEGFRHHDTVRAFGADALLRRRMEASNRATARAMTRRGIVAGAQIPIAQLLVFAAVGALMAVLLGRVRAGAMSAGELVTYLALVALLSTPSQLLPKGLAMLQQARAAARRLRALADAPHADAPSTGHALSSAAPSAPADAANARPLRLVGLSVGYGGEAVLRDVTLDFPRRGLVVLAGESGAGKSTLLRCLLGFLPPLAGRVELAGRPLAELPDAERRRRVGYVPQELDLLSGSLRDNLTLGADLSDAALWEALDTVGLRAVVAALPGGLDHPLGEDGAGLSGGQRQRVAVARALLRDPPLLLLDEPTSALDDDSERALVALLRRQARARLIVAVAHRPALAAAADRLLRIGGGTARWDDAPAMVAAPVAASVAASGAGSGDAAEE